MATVGAVVYPEPWFVTVIPVTAPPEMVAAAVAPLPLPLKITTEGADR
jgi:hypothetical protein